MSYLVKPHNGIWVAVQDGLDEDSLCNKLRSANVCLSDLDDTDADSPARNLAFQDIMGRLSNPEYRRWFLDSLLSLRNGFEEAEHSSGKEYVRVFLQTPEQRKRAAAEFIYYLPDFFFPQVPELYKLLPDAEKFYVSGNIREVIEPSAQFLNFTGSFAEIDDKEQFTHSFVRKHPQFRNYLVREDAQDGNGMVEALRSCAQEGLIDSVLFQHCADKPEHDLMEFYPRDQKYFHFQTGKDQSGLVELLRKGN